MPTGKVKWYNGQKGFGFIEPDDGGKDVFVHVSALDRANISNLPDGQALSYVLEKDSRSGRESAAQLVLED
jgi:cold shock protein